LVTRGANGAGREIAPGEGARLIPARAGHIATKYSTLGTTPAAKPHSLPDLFAELPERTRHRLPPHNFIGTAGTPSGLTRTGRPTAFERDGSRAADLRRSGPERKLAQYAMEREKQWRHGRTPDQISARLANIRGAADHTLPSEQFHARSGPNNAITLSRREWLWSARHTWADIPRDL
jgi:hypothetical protein